MLYDGGGGGLCGGSGLCGGGAWCGSGGFLVLILKEIILNINEK